MNSIFSRRSAISNSVSTAFALAALVPEAKSNAEGRAIPINPEVDQINVKNFGAKGDGSDDTDAIRRAWFEASKLKRSAVNGDFTGVATAVLYFPSGSYIFNGPALETDEEICLTIVGAGKESTRISIKSNTYFILSKKVINGLTIKGIHFTGGKGCLMQLYEGPNVKGYITVESNIFFGYSECAIGSNSNDAPYWKILHNVFYGDGDFNSIGVAISGDVSLTEISSNAFLRNRYHLKISSPGTNVRVENNDFIRFSHSTQETADIWLVPHSKITNAHTGSVYSSNKFGIENRNKWDYVILIADEFKVSEGIQCIAQYKKEKSNGYVVGVTFRDNYYASVAQGAPFISSHTSNLVSLDIRIKSFGSSSQNYIVWIDPDSESQNKYINSQNIIEYAHLASGAAALQHMPVNMPFGLISDPFGHFQGYEDTYSYWQSGSDPSLVDISPPSLLYKGWKLEGGGRAQSGKDSVGNNNALHLTLTENSVFLCDIKSPIFKRPGFVEFDIIGIDVLLNTAMVVSIVDKADRSSIFWQRFVAFPKYWKRIRLPFSISDIKENPKILKFAIKRDGGAGEPEFMVGRINVYHSHEPLNIRDKNVQLVRKIENLVIHPQETVEFNVECCDADEGSICQLTLAKFIPMLLMQAHVSKNRNVVIYFQNNSGNIIFIKDNAINLKISTFLN